MLLRPPPSAKAPSTTTSATAQPRWSPADASARLRSAWTNSTAAAAASPSEYSTSGQSPHGRSVDYAVPADALIGRMTTDGYLVKARVAAGARDADDALYLLTRTRDRDEERRYAARRDFAVEPR